MEKKKPHQYEQEKPMTSWPQNHLMLHNSSYTPPLNSNLAREKNDTQRSTITAPEKQNLRKKPNNIVSIIAATQEAREKKLTKQLSTIGAAEE